MTKRRLEELPPQAIECIARWLKSPSTRQKTSCPFRTKHGTLAYRCDLCRAIFPKLSKRTLCGPPIDCPCLVYSPAYIRRIARQIVKTAQS